MKRTSRSNITIEVARGPDGECVVTLTDNNTGATIVWSGDEKDTNDLACEFLIVAQEMRGGFD